MSQSGRILIIGCGELGSRHLQAVSALGEVAEIEVVDPAPDRLETGRTRVAQVEDRNPKIRYQWLPTLDDASREGDLCVVATQADVRCSIVRDVADRSSYRQFLLEKIVAQSIEDYDDLLALARTRGLAVWVNCKKRGHEAHRRVKARLNPDLPLILSVIGGNHGLATQGVHAADLFAFYDGTNRIDGGEVHVDSVLHPTKRGPDVLELSGTLNGRSEKGSRFFLSLDGSHRAPPVFSVVSDVYRAVVDDMTRSFYESAAESGWQWSQVPYNPDLKVSTMTRSFARDILGTGECELPTLEECRPAHDFILTVLQPHFSRLIGRALDRSPVT